MQRMKMTKLVLSLGAAGILAACDPGIAEGEPGEVTGSINLVSREDGSGTRGAFTELTGVLSENENGEEEDNTYAEAVIQNGTEGVLSTVAQDPNAIGYISLGSLNDTVRGVPIDGVEPTAENVLNGSFPIARNFNIAWDGDLSEVAQDFVTFIQSAEGQAIVVEKGYVESFPDAPAYESKGLSGTVSVVGSTSVSPVMEALSEGYREMNSDVKIDITSNGSSAGMTAAMEGTADIGMASRDLTDEEQEKLSFTSIAVDGITVVVNNTNAIESLTLEQVRQVFTGEITDWADVQ